MNPSLPPATRSSIWSTDESNSVELLSPTDSHSSLKQRNVDRLSPTDSHSSLKHRNVDRLSPTDSHSSLKHLLYYLANATRTIDFYIALSETSYVIRDTYFGL